MKKMIEIERDALRILLRDAYDIGFEDGHLDLADMPTAVTDSTEYADEVLKLIDGLTSGTIPQVAIDEAAAKLPN